MKIIRKCSIFILFTLLVLINIYFNKVNVLAADGDIYYEEEVLETNNLAGGITHRRIKGYSQVTDPSLISGGATEAGYGNAIPLKHNQYYSQQINVLDVPFNTKAKVVPWGVISNGQWTLARVQVMATDYEKNHPGWKVVAAINGDFFDINGNGNLPYGPSGSMVENGDVYRAAGGYRYLGFNNSGTGLKLFSTMVQYDSLPTLSVYDDNNNIIYTYKLNAVNKVAGEGEVSVHFATCDSKHKFISVQVKDAFIVDKAEDTLAFGNKVFFGKGTINRFGNEDNLGQNKFAIISNNPEVTSKLAEGVRIRVQYNPTNVDLNVYKDGIGCHDVVIDNGVPQYDNNGYGNDRMPRTLIGQKENGDLVMIVVDGRQAEFGFYGIANEETAAIVKYYGMHTGYQMDGGGSATMVILKDGELQVINSPSDSKGTTARSDSDCILLAVEVPKIEWTVVAKYDSLEFEVDAIELSEKYKELYIDVDGNKIKVENGKAVFSGLTNNKVYKYEFFTKIDDTYESIVYQGAISTAKLLPELLKLSVTIFEEDGVSKYKINLFYNDIDSSVINIAMLINGKSYYPRNKECVYSTSSPNIIIADALEVKLNYNSNDGQGSKTLVYGIDQIKIDIESPLVVLDASSKILDKAFESSIWN